MRRSMWGMFVAAATFAGCSLLGTGGEQVSRTDGPIARGWIKPGDVLRGVEHARFKERYDTVKVEENLVGMIAQLSEGVDVLVYYGSWCSDSRREVPRFLRIMEKGGFAEDRVRFYALDRSKQSPDGLTQRYGIEMVPTFIFFRDGKEIGRIVELPKTTLEGDIIEILVAARAPGGAGHAE